MRKGPKLSDFVWGVLWAIGVLIVLVALMDHFLEVKP